MSKTGSITKTPVFNDIGIDFQLDWPRIKKLLTIGLFGSICNLISDLLLAWGTEDESLTGVIRMLSAYTQVPDTNIFISATLGLFGIVLEGLCFFGIYRIIASSSLKNAHSYRSAIFGYLIFGACGFHIPVCAASYLLKHLQTITSTEVEPIITTYAIWFVLPAAMLFFISLIALCIIQIKVFAKGQTPYPCWCWVFNPLVGMTATMILNVFGNQPWVSAVTCAWISIGCAWTFGGLLLTLPKED